ncbi:HEPN domain-containing protein [Microcoleus sp. B4-C5]|uniref:HEPN domain-containing protein n=1 Tax=unclassified Microcoleus TaxID=2642155 RepID=UPI002FCF7937
MSKSVRFRTLTKELNRLKKQFIPKVSPTGLYSDRQLALTLTYRVFVHAEIEAYFEDRVWEVTLNAKNNWDSQGKTCRTLICLLAFSGQMMEVPPDTLNPTKGSTKVKEEKIKINKKIDLAIKSFKRVIDQNHGIKEANLLALLLPIGIDTDDLDSAWLGTMNTFGEERGVAVHTSATSAKTIRVLNPINELQRVEQIIQELLKVDELINNLMR